MKVLRAIGRFFARIGRWIRDTAWIQPLLIVGGIFGIIFSIPYITNWVKSWFEEGNTATAYYKKTKLTWKGIENGNSQVDGLFKYLENPDEDAAGKKKFGDKFFVAFVQEDCAGCESNYEGFKELQSSWNKSIFQTKETFKMFTIFIDETNDDDEEYFTEYVSGDKSTCRYNDFFDAAAATKNPYVDNVKGGEEYYAKLAGNDNSFESPIVVLIDLNFEGDAHYEIGDFGATEIFYQISGKKDADTPFAKAQAIFDCWNHEGIFSIKGE